MRFTQRVRMESCVTISRRIILLLSIKTQHAFQNISLPFDPLRARPDVVFYAPTKQTPCHMCNNAFFFFNHDMETHFIPETSRQIWHIFVSIYHSTRKLRDTFGFPVILTYNINYTTQ